MKFFRPCLLIPAILSVLSFSACDVEELSTLQELSKPYAAQYRCDALRYGEEDLLSRFDLVTLTLCPNGSFLLNCRDREGKTQSHSGTYEFRESTVAFTVMFRGTPVTREFPYEDGAVMIACPLAGKLLYAHFTL